MVFIAFACSALKVDSQVRCELDTLSFDYVKYLPPINCVYI